MKESRSDLRSLFQRRNITAPEDAAPCDGRDYGRSTHRWHPGSLAGATFPAARPQGTVPGQLAPVVVGLWAQASVWGCAHRTGESLSGAFCLSRWSSVSRLCLSPYWLLICCSEADTGLGIQAPVTLHKVSIFGAPGWLRWLSV